MPQPQPDVATAFRAEVVQLRAGEKRRSFPMRVVVGLPTGAQVSCTVPWPVPAGYDTGLRFDVLDALLGRWKERDAVPAYAWLSRPGVPVPHDCDLAWQSAAFRAFGAHEVELLGFWAVTRTGWLNVGTGESRAWKRPRR